METKTSSSVDDYKEGVKRDAEELVLKRFPKKVLEVDQLLKDKRFGLKSLQTMIKLNSTNLKDIEGVGGQSPNKKLKTSEETENESQSEDQNQNPIVLELSNRNKCLEEIVSLVRPLMLEFVDDMLSLKIGINLMIPKIEDGNNFGVEVQQEIIESVSATEEDMYCRLTNISTFYSARAELVSKLVKHPFYEDCRFAIEERDHSFKVFLNVSLILVRNYYTNLHDLILKNLNKIKKPKTGGNEEMLY